MQKLYSSNVFNVNTPVGLLQKLWFELCLFFCRRGREKQRDLKPEMFTLKTDERGLRYVCQVCSEISKNDQGLLSIKSTIKLPECIKQRLNFVPSAVF